jgi:elongation factor Ts
MPIDAQLISKLRASTGAGLSDIKSALDESQGSEEQAIEILRKKGALKAAKKVAERTAGDGLIESYIHSNGRVGVLVQVRCETDFVARTDDFKELAHELALQIAGANPLYVSRAEVPNEVLEKEREIYREQLKGEGKPENMWDTIIEGKLNKYFSDVCLLEQSFIKDDTKTIQQILEEHIAKLGEKIEVGKFTRFQI